MWVCFLVLCTVCVSGSHVDLCGQHVFSSSSAGPSNLLAKPTTHAYPPPPAHVPGARLNFDGMSPDCERSTILRFSR